MNDAAAPAPVTGTIISIRGAVVDVRFGGADLPPINSAMIIDQSGQETLVLEVHSHVDTTTVRGIAMQARAAKAGVFTG